MRVALDEARQGDSPFGAVIVRDGQVLLRGRNLGRTNGDPAAHGEMIAIRRCLADHGSASLRGSTVSTTGEPNVTRMVRFFGAASDGWLLPRLSCEHVSTDCIRR
jgi:tRNA(Arg) A34 adenosine deaminase TadA